MDIERKYIDRNDGTRIATYATGPRDGPVMVLSNGLGGNYGTWRHLVSFFRHRFRVLSWDYRGLFGSGRPPADLADAYSMRRQCEDCEALLAAEGAGRAVFVGWSMGVQVNFEYYRHAPRRFLGMVQINGTYGRPFETAFRGEWMRKVAPYFLSLFEGVSPVARAVEPLATRTRAIVAIAKATGLVSPTLDEEVFFDLVSDYLHLDFEAYAATFRVIGEHSAEDVLPTIGVPTLIVTGEKDLFTPLELSERMRSLIPGSELLVVKGGTHYTPVEYPMVVNLKIERFLKDRVGACCE